MKNTFHQFVLTAALLLSPCQMQAQFFIGQDTLGGKVAFIDASGIHGLIAAASDQSIGMRWNNGVSTNYVLTQATNTIMYAGGANTTRIISVLGVPSSGDYAANLCRNYRGGGYTDWYLPSKDELNRLYANRLSIGGFAPNRYWSSSENSREYAWYQNFYDGGQSFLDPKASQFRVRAVRAF